METISIKSEKSANEKFAVAARVINWLVILFLLMDAIMKIALNHYHIEGTTNLGFNESAVQPIGILLLICTILYIIPATKLIGAILLTGYLGGAVAIMARVGEPFYFPLTFGIVIWLTIFLRNAAFRALLVNKLQ